jgi:two-component system sensor histidine kinase HydH
VEGRAVQLRGRRRWWFGAAGALGGLLDTALFLWLGIDLSVAGLDLTLPVALYLATSFAVICFGVGHYMDARERAREDAATISRQLEALEASQRIAAQNEKLAAIGRLAAGIAHEVRNPLGVMRASASMVQEGFAPDDEAHRACQFICDESDRLNGLITSLLAFARPAEPRREQLRARNVIERALALASRDLERRGIAAACEASEDVPAIQADPDLLSQAVLDLVTNASEAVGHGGRIAVRLRGGDLGLDIEVADDGPGVSIEQPERVFEPFFTTKPSGTGLGLAMTARIAESHGGHVELLQGRGLGSDGGGACFRIHLPLQAVGAAA